MKKFIYLMTGMALAIGATGCVDTEKPVFQEPTTFIVNAPAFQDEYHVMETTLGFIKSRTCINCTTLLK